ncbi:MAG: bifunctional metallophosphatase/5'-nucleotidase [Ignavibacteria bacterium]
MKNIIYFIILFLLLPFGEAGRGFSQDNIREIRILHWNDFHAHNLPIKSTKKDSSGNTITYYYGGTSDMLGYLNKYRNSHSLVLVGGDDFQGTPISNITKGKSQIELLNLYNIDAFVLGNHEFDYGQYALDSSLSEAQFNYLSSNLFYSPKNSTFGKQWLIKELNGVKIGIIGLVPPNLDELTLPRNIDRAKVLNRDSVLSADITVLKNEKCNLIVLLTHEGVDEDKLVAEKFYKDVDVIVGGHSHTPLFKPVIDSGVIIVQAGAFSRWLGELDLKVDLDKDTVTHYYGKLIETVMDSSVYDKAAAEKVDEMESGIKKEMEEVIGKLESGWKNSHYNESNLGDFESDAFRKIAGTDIAFINGGGLRKSLPKGDITVRDIWEINPFGNEIMKFSITGTQLKQMLQNNTLIRLQLAAQKSPIEILDCSGLSYSYDSKKFPDDSLNLITEIKVNGKELDENKAYSISTNVFVTSQFKRFFGEIDGGIQFKNTGLIDRDVIMDVIREQKVIKSKNEKRITDIAKDKYIDIDE